METKQELDEIEIIALENEEKIEKLHNNNRNNTNNPIYKFKELSNSEILSNLKSISILNLSNCGLYEVPPALRRLHLKELNLSRNKIVEVPSCLFSGFSKLEILDLSYNLINNFDIEPACCMILKILRINNNNIYNIPQWILVGRARNLEEFIYSFNKIEDVTTRYELKLNKVEFINCELLDRDLNFFSNLKCLKDLNIGNTSSRNRNTFSDIEIFFEKPKWTAIKVLHLDNLLLSIVPKGIFWLDTLIELHICGCELSWICPEIEYLINLTILDISNNQICSLPIQLTSLTNLKILKASNNIISFIEGQFASKLSILDVYCNYLEESPLDNLENIDSIDLELNCFDTCDLKQSNLYIKKREKLRDSIDNNVRDCGKREIEIKEEEEEEKDSSSEHSEWTSDPNDACIIYGSGSDLDENWEDEIGEEVVIYEKNENITASDEEWCGNETGIIKKSNLIKQKQCLEEDWLFCDAD